MRHYFHHFIFANIGLLIAYFLYGSVTVWEIVFFFFMTFIPFLDELAFVTLTYLERKESRYIINLLLVGEIRELLTYMHRKRINFEQLYLHNVPMYLGLCALFYVFLSYDLSVLYYGLAGVIVHLIFDVINDQYEFGNIAVWFWPFTFK